MENDCALRPGQICRNGGRLELLEKRVDDLEGGQEREEAFRRTYYADREARLVRDAVLDRKMEGMDAKLDKLVAWKEDRQNRPNLLLDGFRDKLLAALAGALAAGLLAGAAFLLRAIL